MSGNKYAEARVNKEEQARIKAEQKAKQRLEEEKRKKKIEAEKAKTLKELKRKEKQEEIDRKKRYDAEQLRLKQAEHERKLRVKQKSTELLSVINVTQQAISNDDQTMCPEAFRELSGIFSRIKTTQYNNEATINRDAQLVTEKWQMFCDEKSMLQEKIEAQDLIAKSIQEALLEQGIVTEKAYEGDRWREDVVLDTGNNRRIAIKFPNTKDDVEILDQYEDSVGENTTCKINNSNLIEALADDSRILVGKKEPLDITKDYLTIPTHSNNKATK